MNMALLAFKGVPFEESNAWFCNPANVRMRLPTEEELQKIAEKDAKNEKLLYRGLIALAKGNGVNVKTMSREEFNKKMKDVR